MSLLSTILIILSIIKLIMVYSLIKQNDSNISDSTYIDLETFKKGIIFLILDGMIGLFCGVYLLSL